MLAPMRGSSVWSASRGSGEGSWIETRQFQARMIKYRTLPDGARRAECLSRGHDGRTVRLGARNDQVMRRLQSADNEGPG